MRRTTSERGGISYQATLLRVSAVIAALARADLVTAETRWARTFAQMKSTGSQRTRKVPRWSACYW